MSIKMLKVAVICFTAALFVSGSVSEGEERCVFPKIYSSTTKGTRNGKYTTTFKETVDREDYGYRAIFVNTRRDGEAIGIIQFENENDGYVFVKEDNNICKNMTMKRKTVRGFIPEAAKFIKTEKVGKEDCNVWRYDVEGQSRYELYWVRADCMVVKGGSFNKETDQPILVRERSNIYFPQTPEQKQELRKVFDVNYKPLCATPKSPSKAGKSRQQK